MAEPSSHQLAGVIALRGPAPLTGVTLQAYAGSYGGAKQPSVGPGFMRRCCVLRGPRCGPGGGGSHGMQFGDPFSPPWMFATPPTDITEPWMPGVTSSEYVHLC